MKTPTYTPQVPLSSSVSYEDNIREYGDPPAGWRWRGRDERPVRGDIRVSNVRFNVLTDGYPDPTNWPVITPVAKPASTNLLRRVDTLRAKIAASQKLIVAESERVGDHYVHMIYNPLGAGCWPVIRRAAEAPVKVPAPKTPAPKLTLKSLLVRIEALEKKLGGKVGLTFGD